MTDIEDDDLRIEEALRAADQTRLMRAEPGLRHHAAAWFRELFGPRPAVIVADANTFAAAGRDVLESFRHAGHACAAPFVFEDAGLEATFENVLAVERAAAVREAIPVAVGSGTINDLVKLASHRLGRPYVALATAASMDGYAAFGASILREGSKQTFECPAPAGILADLQVIEAAPQYLNASGYADLLAKTVAGADWILADSMQVEPIDANAWKMIQGALQSCIADPAGIPRREPRSIRQLTLGLVMSGLAMQRTRTSRVASGAEHQFSHLWDMQHHLYQGKTPTHGFKVGIGTLASAALYEQILARPLEHLDVDRAVSSWPHLEAIEADIERRFCGWPDLKSKAIEETHAKYTDTAGLREQLTRLRSDWAAIRQRVRTHLPSYDELASRLVTAGCPVAPREIGIPASRLRESYRQAYYLRRRFTVLDLAVRAGLLETLLDDIFGPQGRWPMHGEREARAPSQATARK